MNWGQKGIAAGITVILAAIVGPSDFGLVAIASVFIFFVNIFVEQGLHVAIVQRKDLKDEHVDACFWFTMALSLALAALGVGLAGWWASVNDEPRLAPIISVLSVSILLTGLTIVPQALLAKAMAFKSLAIRSNLAAIVGGAVGIVMALRGDGVWALVGQRIVSQAASVALLWKVSNWTPGFRLSRPHLLEMLSFSSRSLLARMADFVGNRADVVIMGLLFGPIAVGMYKLAERLVSLPMQLLARSLTMPALSHLSSADPQGEAFSRRLRNCLRINAAIVFPAMAMLAVTATPIMRIMGEEWRGAEWALVVLACAGVPRSILMIMGTGVIAAGKPQYDALVMWVSAAAHLAGVTAIGYTLRDATPVTQAWAIAGSHAILAIVVDLPLHLHFLRRASAVSIAGSLLAVAPGVLVVAIILTVGAPAQYGLSQFESLGHIIEFILLGVLSGVVGAGATLLLFPDVRERLRELLFAGRAAPVPLSQTHGPTGEPEA